MTIYVHVNKVGIPLSEVFLWSCFFIYRIVPGERVLMHVNYGRLSRSTCGIRVIHMALRWGSSKLVVHCTDLWASLKCRSTIEVSSRRTWSLGLVRSLFSKTVSCLRDWRDQIGVPLSKQIYNTDVRQCVTEKFRLQHGSWRYISKINKPNHYTVLPNWGFSVLFPQL